MIENFKFKFGKPDGYYKDVGVTYGWTNFTIEEKPQVSNAVGLPVAPRGFTSQVDSESCGGIDCLCYQMDFYSQKI